MIRLFRALRLLGALSAVAGATVAVLLLDGSSDECALVWGQVREVHRTAREWVLVTSPPLGGLRLVSAPRGTRDDRVPQAGEWVVGRGESLPSVAGVPRQAMPSLASVVDSREVAAALGSATIGAGGASAAVLGVSMLTFHQVLIPAAAAIASGVVAALAVDRASHWFLPSVSPVFRWIVAISAFLGALVWIAGGGFLSRVVMRAVAVAVGISAAPALAVALGWPVVVVLAFAIMGGVLHPAVPWWLAGGYLVALGVGAVPGTETLAVLGFSKAVVVGTAVWDRRRSRTRARDLARALKSVADQNDGEVPLDDLVRAA